MKVQILLPLSIAVAVASFGLMKIRLKEVLDEEKLARFQDVKLRVTGDVLSEYVKEKQNTESQLEEATKEQKELETDLNTLEKTGLEGKKAELESCKGKKVRFFFFLQKSSYFLMTQVNTASLASLANGQSWHLYLLTCFIWFMKLMKARGIDYDL